MRGLSLVAASGGHSAVAVQGLPFPCGGFFCGAQVLGHVGFLVVEHGLCSCDTRA